LKARGGGKSGMVGVKSRGLAPQREQIRKSILQGATSRDERDLANGEITGEIREERRKSISIEHLCCATKERVRSRMD